MPKAMVNRSSESLRGVVVALGVTMAAACGGDRTAPAASTSPTTGTSEGAGSALDGAPGQPADPAHFAGLTTGRHAAVEFMMTMPEALDPLQQRFVAATAGNPPWLQEHLAKHDLQPGQRLPYHPSFGVTEREYEQLVDAYEHPVVAEVRRFELTVRRDGGRLQLEAPEPHAWLSTLVIDDGGRLTFGSVTIDRPEPASAKAKFGAWSGHAWHRQASTPPANVDRLEVELGHTTNPRRRFLHVDRALGSPAGMVEQRQLLIWID